MRKVLIATIATTLVAQQQTPSQDSPQLVLKATARLVQVSVVVHDKKGQPVADLKKEDFQIKVDGHVQSISLFSVDSAGSLPSSPEKLPQNTFTNRLEQRPGTPSSVTIILLDAINTRYMTNPTPDNRSSSISKPFNPPITSASIRYPGRCAC